MKEKERALFVLGVAGLISIVVSICLGIIIITFFPLLVTFSLILIGMGCKWAVEWCIKNIHIFKIRGRSKRVKNKLKIDKGINAVKNSYKVLKGNDNK